MVVQSNQDASKQQLYRDNNNDDALLLGGAAALGGLALLLSRGRGAGSIADNVAKNADNLATKSTDELAQAAQKVYEPSPQGAVDKLRDDVLQQQQQAVDTIRRTNETPLGDAVADISRTNDIKASTVDVTPEDIASVNIPKQMPTQSDLMGMLEGIDPEKAIGGFANDIATALRNGDIKDTDTLENFYRSSTYTNAINSNFDNMLTKIQNQFGVTSEDLAKVNGMPGLGGLADKQLKDIDGFTDIMNLSKQVDDVVPQESPAKTFRIDDDFLDSIPTATSEPPVATGGKYPSKRGWRNAQRDDGDVRLLRPNTW